MVPHLVLDCRGLHLNETKPFSTKAKVSRFVCPRKYICVILSRQRFGIKLTSHVDNSFFLHIRDIRGSYSNLMSGSVQLKTCWSQHLQRWINGWLSLWRQEWTAVTRQRVQTSPSKHRSFWTSAQAHSTYTTNVHNRILYSLVIVAMIFILISFHQNYYIL